MFQKEVGDKILADFLVVKTIQTFYKNIIINFNLFANIIENNTYT